jgi:hypothetical protein
MTAQFLVHRATDRGVISWPPMSFARHGSCHIVRGCKGATMSDTVTLHPARGGFLGRISISLPRPAKAYRIPRAAGRGRLFLPE